MEKKQDTKSSLINIPSLLKAYVKSWKWVITSMVFFLALGAIVYLKRESKCEVVAQLLISDESSSRTSSLGNIASMFGGGGAFGANRSVEDEMIVIKSHSLLKETAKNLSLNERYFVEKNILKKTEVHFNPPVKLIYDKNIADTLGVQLKFDITVNESGIADIKVRGLKNNVILKVKDSKLPCSLTTPYGEFTIVTTASYIPEEPLDETIILSSYDAAALGLDKTITVDYSAKKTDIMALSYITNDAQFGRDVLNTLIDNYNQLTIKQKQAFNQKTLDFIEDRIRTLSSEVDSTQRKVEDFMGRKDLVNPGAQAGIYITRTSSQEVELVKAESEYELLNMAIEFLSNEANNTSMLPIMPSTASLTPLIEGYNSLILSRLELESSAKGDNLALKAMNTRINAVRDNLLAALNKQSETANFQIAEMRRQFAKSKSKLETMPGIEREYADIMREQNLKEQLYVFLLRQREETEMAIAGAHPRGVIIDEAFVTDAILGMSPKIIICVFLMLGLLVPALFILCRWYLSRTISIIDQAVDLSGGMPVITNSPIAPQSEPAVIMEPDSLFSCRMRLLRGNLLSLESTSNGFTAAIAGFDDNETVPVVALNLATSLAISGRRTLLIEANPFNPVIGSLVNVTQRENKYGLNGIVSFSSIETNCNSNTLDFMSFDRNERFGADIVASLEFESILRRLPAIYDAVIIAAPSLDKHYASVEIINNMSNILLATVTVGKTLKGDVKSLSMLDNHSGNSYLIEIEN